jgi:hypothetical protein
MTMPATTQMAPMTSNSAGGLGRLPTCGNGFRAARRPLTDGLPSGIPNGRRGHERSMPCEV